MIMARKAVRRDYFPSLTRAMKAVGVGRKG